MSKPEDTNSLVNEKKTTCARKEAIGQTCLEAGFLKGNICHHCSKEGRAKLKQQEKNERYYRGLASGLGTMI